jgi:hypothetical protein
LVLGTLLKIPANFYVVTEWTPAAGDKARREVNKRRRHFNISKTGLCRTWVTMQPASSPFLSFLRKATLAPYRLLERVEDVSQKSLTATLGGLERDGLARRSITAQVPIRVDYEATTSGHELIVEFQLF